MLIINFAPTGKFVDAGNNIYVLDETVELTYSFASTEASLNNIYEPTTSKTHDSNIYSYSYLQSADSTYELTASEVSKTYEATGVTSDNTDSIPSCACDIDPKTNDCDGEAATETPGTSCYDEIVTLGYVENFPIDVTKYKVYNVLLEGEDLASCACDIDPETNDCDGEAATETPGTSCYDEIEFTTEGNYIDNNPNFGLKSESGYKVYNVGVSTAAGLASCACDIDPKTNDCNNKAATENPGTSCYDEIVTSGYLENFPIDVTKYKVYNVVGIDADLINKCDCDTTKDDDCTDELTKSSIGTQCYELVQIQTGTEQFDQNFIPVFGPAYNKYIVEAAKDKDGDGIIDQLDKCPNTPDGRKVDGIGCPIDSGLTPPTDTTPPTVLVPDDMTVESLDGSDVVVTFIVTATDNFGVVSGPSCSPASKGSLVHPSPATGLSVSRQFTKKYTVGTTIVSCLATDAAGNTGTEEFDITVTVTTPVDTTPPIVLVPDDIYRVSTDGLAVSVTFSVSATDNIGVVSGPTCDPASNSAFSVGTKTVSCLATDAAGNTGTEEFDITVTVTTPVDTTPPIVLVPDDIYRVSTDGLAVSVTFSVSATDNIGVVSGPTCDPASNSAFSVGTKTVSCSATDAAGNTGIESFDIIVTDTTPVVPPVVPSDTLVILNDVGNNQCSLAITVETSIVDALIILQIKDTNDLIVAYEYQTRSLVAGITQTLTIDKPNTASLCEGFLWEDWSGTPLTNKVKITI
jgi:hypothetical protein